MSIHIDSCHFPNLFGYDRAYIRIENNNITLYGIDFTKFINLLYELERLNMNIDTLMEVLTDV